MSLLVAATNGFSQEHASLRNCKDKLVHASGTIMILPINSSVGLVLVVVRTETPCSLDAFFRQNRLSEVEDQLKPCLMMGRHRA